MTETREHKGTRAGAFGVSRGDAGTFLRLRIGPFSAHVRLRVLVVSALMLLPILVSTYFALALGTIEISFTELMEVLRGDGGKALTKVVIEWRFPRALEAIIIGASLGLSGAIFQSLTKNPLGSPDIVGFNNGAYVGVIGVTILGLHGLAWTSVGAVIGGLATAVVVYALAFRRGVQGFRFIIVGIAVSAMLASLNTWFSIVADLDVAMEVAVWGAGSLLGTTWNTVAFSGIVIGLFVVALLLVGRWLPFLELGDDVSTVLGLPVERAKAILILLGVAFTAIATAVAGPILFVALAAPQIARLLCRTGQSVTLLGSAAVGAAIVPAADVLAQHAFGNANLPVGAITVCVGGIYLVWLLSREARTK